MAWAEVTYKSSPDHESMVDHVYTTFYDISTKRQWLWTPHLSLVYDNPEAKRINIDMLSFLSGVVPSLLCKKRKIVAISLWSTIGKLNEWKCIDRLEMTTQQEAPTGNSGKGC